MATPTFARARTIAIAALLVCPAHTGRYAAVLGTEQLAEALAFVRRDATTVAVPGVCALHGMPLVSGCAFTVHHGIACPDPYSRPLAQQLHFPNANSRVHIDGCVYSRDEPITTPVMYCPRCRTFESAWNDYSRSHWPFPLFIEPAAYHEAWCSERGLPNPSLQRTRYARR